MLFKVFILLVCFSLAQVSRLVPLTIKAQVRDLHQPGKDYRRGIVNRNPP